MNVRVALACAIIAIAFGGLIPRQVGADEPTTRSWAPHHAWPKRQVIEGVVEDGNEKRVRATIGVFNAETGLLYNNLSDDANIDVGNGADGPLPGMHVDNGTDGRFFFPGIFPGTYRLVAQSWEGVDSLKQLNKSRSNTVTLRGVIENFKVTEDKKPAYVFFKPIGTATVHVKVKGMETFVLVSTKPPGDAVLSYYALAGPFLQHLIGAAVVRAGQDEATFHGLPDGRLYFCAVFDRDMSVAVGESSVVAEAGETAETSLTMVVPNGKPLKIPARLLAFEEIEKAQGKEVRKLVEDALGPEFSERRSDMSSPSIFAYPLDREMTLSTGEVFTLRDFLTLEAYHRFNREAQHPTSGPGAGGW